MIEAYGAPMTQERLHGTLEALADHVEIQGNMLRMEVDGTPVICLTDPQADRMRLISPVRDVEGPDAQEMLAALKANFHTTLDARYAIGGDTLYAAFIHPLSPLTADQVRSAVHQVVEAARNFGTTFSSGDMVFPGDGY